MAKQCEVCGKKPVVGRQPRQQRDRPPVRAEPSANSRHRERRQPLRARLHPVHPVQQGHQGRLNGRPARAGLDHGGSRGDRSLQPGDHRRGFLFASGQILSIP